MKFVRVESYLHGGQAYTTESGMKYVRLSKHGENGYTWYKLPGVTRAPGGLDLELAKAREQFWLGRELDSSRGITRERRKLPDTKIPKVTFVVSLVSAILLLLAYLTA